MSIWWTTVSNEVGLGWAKSSEPLSDRLPAAASRPDDASRGKFPPPLFGRRRRRRRQGTAVTTHYAPSRAVLVNYARRTGSSTSSSSSSSSNNNSSNGNSNSSTAPPLLCHPKPRPLAFGSVARCRVSFWFAPLVLCRDGRNFNDRRRSLYL